MTLQGSNGNGAGTAERVPAALDERWLQDNLPRYLALDGNTAGDIVHVQIRQPRMTSEGRLALYRVCWQRGDDPVVEQLYVGYQVPAATLHDTYHLLRARAQRLPAVGPPILMVEDADLILLAFPNDRRVRFLSEGELKTWVAEHVSAVIGDRADKTWRLVEAQVDVLRYVPEKRMTVRCRGTAESSAGTIRPFSFIAKQFKSKKRAGSVYRTLATFPGNSAAHPVRVPRAMTFDAEPGIVLMEDLPGRELKRALPEEDAERLIFEAGQLMAAFHQIPKRVRARVTHRTELRQVVSAGRTVIEAFPAMRPRVRAVMAKLRAWMPVEGPYALLHGACRLKHLFVHDGRLALVDLDGMCVGPPSFDLCHFLTSLYYLEEQERFDTSERRTYARRFLEGYAQDTRLNIGPRMLLWYFAAMVIHKQASKYVTHLHDDSEEKTDCMLALAETALARYPDAPADGSLAGAWEFLP